jgi:hypothetical protein
MLASALLLALPHMAIAFLGQAPSTTQRASTMMQAQRSAAASESAMARFVPLEISWQDRAFPFVSFLSLRM